jgi:hypothetical protein
MFGRDLASAVLKPPRRVSQYGLEPAALGEREKIVRRGYQSWPPNESPLARYWCANFRAIGMMEQTMNDGKTKFVLHRFAASSSISGNPSTTPLSATKSTGAG